MNLDSISDVYEVTPPYSKVRKDIIISIYQEHIDTARNLRVLQMGLGGGYETKILKQIVPEFDAIDGALTLIQKFKAQEEFRGVNFICSNFEDYSPELRYDCILCTYIFEHVQDPVLLLKHIRKSLLNKDGKIFIVVPNSGALSRRLAIEMGMLKSPLELTPNDLRHGHRRVYSKETLEEDLKSGSFRIDFIAGIIFKILADFQFDELLTHKFITEDHIWALQKLAGKEGNEEFSDSLLVIARAVND